MDTKKTAPLTCNRGAASDKLNSRYMGGIERAYF
jgi:hypothetical protein